MSPRRRKAEDDEVFAALVRVMLRCGPAELTLAAIAAEAGVTASALVQRFGSKRALLLAHARHAAASGDIGFGAPLRSARRHRSARCAASLRFMRSWRSHRVPPCGISRTCRTILPTRRSVVTCCV